MCRNKIEILEIPCERLRSEAQKVFERMMGIRKGNSYSVYQQEEYIELQKKIESQMKIHVLLKKADSFLSEKHNIWMEEQKIEHVEFFEEFPSLIQDIYVYLVSIDLEPDTESVMEQFLYHTWESAYLEVARKWLRQWIAKREKKFVSSSLSPGFYGIPLDTMKIFYSILEGEKIGVSLKGGVLIPQQSVLGMYCVMKQELNLFYKQCDACPAKGKHCEFCMEED